MLADIKVVIEKMDGVGMMVGGYVLVKKKINKAKAEFTLFFQFF